MYSEYKRNSYGVVNSQNLECEVMFECRNSTGAGGYGLGAISRQSVSSHPLFSGFMKCGGSSKSILGS